MKRIYAPHKFISGERMGIIHQANDIVDEYQAQGLTLTLRQLYYQFVARGLLPNRDSEYKRLGSIVTDARMQGLTSWTAIEDRTRHLRRNGHWETPGSILDAAAATFRFDLWRDQPNRVEVWIEKDALLGVIESACQDLDVSYFACRGYVSASEMWVAAQRIGGYFREGQQVTILHLGDHDPSGIQMTEDIRGRLERFCFADHLWDEIRAIEAVRNWPTSMEIDQAAEAVRAMPHELVAPTVRRIALTMDQVEEYDPPPNPAKLSDSRAREYVQRYGSESWELDALDPATLRDLIQSEVEALRDDALMRRAERRQDEARAELSEAAREFHDRW